MQHEGGEIDVAMWVRDGKLHASVRDQGIGLPPGMEEAIFVPFGFATQATGFGLGLSIARSLTDAMEGAISAESSGPNQGTTFRFWVPLLSDGGAALPRKKEEEREVVSTPPMVQGVAERPRTCLVLEDSEVLLRVLVTMLRKCAPLLRMDAVSTPLEAVCKVEEALARRQPYDLIMTDYYLEGGMDGAEFAALVRLKETHHRVERRTRVVGLSAMTDNVTRERGLALGLDAFLKKPATPDMLTEQLKLAGIR